MKVKKVGKNENLKEIYRKCFPALTVQFFVLKHINTVLLRMMMM